MAGRRWQPESFPTDMASLDTNCILRWFLDDVPAQRQRLDALMTARQALVVDDAAVIEAVCALEHGAKLKRQTIRGFLDALAAQPVEMNRSLWSGALDIWVERPKLSVVDVYLTVKAGLAGEQPLYTFDAKLAHQLEGAQVVPGASS